MALLPSLSHAELHQFHRVVTRAVQVRSHFDVFVWLQGDMQRYMPHDILIAAWGHFDEGDIKHDIVSALTGVRSENSNPATLTPLLLQLFTRWREFGKTPFTLNAGDSGFLLEDTGLKCALGDSLQTMRTAMVHGISDERGSHECLYITFSAREHCSDAERGAMAVVLPYIDTAMRQVAHLPHQSHKSPRKAASAPAGQASPSPLHDLSERETEVLCWVALGKTNPEIGNILRISGFTVKNHMQRVFKKLDVTNRAQAVNKYRALASHV